MLQIVVTYMTDEERESAILSNNNLFLIEEKNITDGNFLLFSDVAPNEELSEIEVLKNTILELSDELSGGIL